jgi:hypothetical protein
MAIIKVENAEVIRKVGSRGGFAINENITLPDGRSFPKSYTVWLEGEAPNIGALVTVVGVYSAKLREYPAPSGMKHAIDVSINEPEVTVLHDKKPSTEEVPF